jgi:hypothetical protein
MNETIGHIDCPACRRPGAAVKLSKKRKAYILCDGDEGCGFQGFARGQDAHQGIIQAMTPIAKIEAAPAPEIKPGVNVTRHTADGETVREIIAPPAEETTIFDIALKALRKGSAA